MSTVTAVVSTNHMVPMKIYCPVGSSYNLLKRKCLSIHNRQVSACVNNVQNNYMEGSGSATI